MNDTWMTVLCIALASLGALAEINLLRSFLRDWREGKREEMGTRFRSGHANTACRRTPQRQPWKDPRSQAVMIALVMGAGSGFAFGQETAAEPQTPAEGAAASTEAAPPTDAQKSPFSVQLNLDYTTAYFYHGILQEDTGLILQPAARLNVNLYEQDDFKVDALLGVWNSFHGQKTGSQTQGDFTEYWYEADLIGGFTLTKGKVSLTTTYTFLTSPNDAYETVQELGFNLAYDDSDLLGAFSLHPYALLVFETGADGSDGGSTQPGTYLELGVAPGFSFDLGKTPVAITFPASLGLSLNDYYQNATGDDDTFGFAQVGVKASVPLPFAERYGKWTLYAGVSGLFLGDHTADINGGDREEVIGTIGVQVNF